MPLPPIPHGYPKPGHEWDLVIAYGVGLLLFILLVIYLSIKMGIKPTLELFGLWPRRPHGSQQETGTDD